MGFFKGSMKAHLLGKLSHTCMIPGWLACSKLRDLYDHYCKLQPLLATFLGAGGGLSVPHVKLRMWRCELWTEGREMWVGGSHFCSTFEGCLL